MNTSIPPIRRPGGRQLLELLGGDPAADAVLERAIEQLGLDELPALAGLVRNAVTEARKGDTSREGYVDGRSTVQREVEAAYDLGLAEGAASVPPRRVSWLGVAALLLLAVVVGVGSFHAAAAVTRPHCPTEDSCTVDYRDGQWHIIEDAR